MASETEMLARPELRAVRGGWMAVSEEGSQLRLAVIAESRDEALARFETSLAAWARLEEDDGDG